MSMAAQLGGDMEKEYETPPETPEAPEEDDAEPADEGEEDGETA